MLLKLAWKMFHANNTFGLYHRHVRRIAKETIKKSCALNDGSIPVRIYKKIQWYMVEAVIMGEMLADLAQYPLKRHDKKSLIYLGAIMALFDVIIDDFRPDRISVNRILDNTFSPDVNSLRHKDTSIEKVYYLYLDKLMDTIEKEQWSEITGYLNMIRSQIESEKQYDSTVTEENLNRITLQKGGVSALICSVFIRQKTESLKEAVYQIGGFIQMMNDCQDIYKDTVSGIKTFVHFKTGFNDIFRALDEKRISSFKSVMSVDIDINGRIKTLFDLNAMFIVISYKLKRYAELCNYNLDFELIASLSKEKFRINPFFPGAIRACYGKIIRFEAEKFESSSAFVFDK